MRDMTPPNEPGMRFTATIGRTILRPVNNPGETDKSDRAKKLRRFRIVISLASLIFSALIGLTLIRIGVIPPGPFKFALPEELVARHQSYPVAEGALVLEEEGAEKTGHRYIYDELLGWRNIPNWQSTTFGKKLTINSKGLRDSEHAFAKPPGVKRVLVLGDSFAWGYGVADDEIFTSALEGLLQQREDSKWEVINTGVSGWSTDQQYLFLREEGLKYEPDIVLLAFCSANDVKGSMTARLYGLSKPLYRRPHSAATQTDALLEFINIPPPKPGEGTGQHMTFSGPSQEIMKPLIHGIHKLAAEHGARFMMASFGRFLNPANSKVKQWANEAKAIMSGIDGALFLDVDFEFWDRGLALEDLVDESIEHDGHWDAAGHRLVAEILLEYLEREGALNAPDASTPAPQR